MGRWGDDIYDSDAALDYLSTITHRLERELVFWLAPEHIESQSYWLNEVLTVLELILVFERHRFGNTIFLSHERSEQAVRRWREVLFSIWDRDWQDEPSRLYRPLGSYEYRQQHRPALVTIFDRLERIAYYWNHLETERGKDLPPLDLSLPYFSLIHWTGKDGRQGVSGGRLTGELVVQLVKDIITLLSAEKRGQLLSFLTMIEELWVAVDLLSILCTAYDMSPDVRVQDVRNWRDTAISIEKQTLADNHMEWYDDYLLYKQVFAAFDRLETAAQKHPPIGG